MDDFHLLPSRHPETISRLLAKWRAVALSTAASDRSQAAEGVCRHYAQFDLPPPRLHWCASPKEAVRAWRKRLPLCRRRGENVLRGTNFQIGFGLRVRQSTRMEKVISSRIREEAHRILIWGLPGSYADCIKEALFPGLREVLAPCFYGQHDAPWMAWYEYFAMVLERPDLWRPWQAFAQVAATTGLILPETDDCWMVERPIENHGAADGTMVRGRKILLRYGSGFLVRSPADGFGDGMIQSK